MSKVLFSFFLSFKLRCGRIPGKVHFTFASLLPFGGKTNDPPQTSIIIVFYIQKADLMYLTAEGIFTSQTRLTNTIDSFVI